MVIVGASSADTIRTDESRPLLSREKFETNSLAFHDELPVIVEGPSSLIVDHVAPGAARFIHVDASHLCPDRRGKATVSSGGCRSRSSRSA